MMISSTPTRQSKNQKSNQTLSAVYDWFSSFVESSTLLEKMPTTLVIASPIQIFFYYVFHVIFLGHPADILARLWLAHDLAYPDGRDLESHEDYDYEENVRKAWLNFEESIRESYKTIGVLVGKRS